MFAEGSVYVCLFNSRRWVATFIKILLFGAVTHHAGMSNFSFLLGTIGRSSFIGHKKYSVRGGAYFNPTSKAWFRIYN